jgi:glycosyltransferase involved in cell wall biosynthesis
MQACQLSSTEPTTHALPLPEGQAGAQAPLVSVILSSYNYARYLPEALDSVLNQSWTNLELIAVDDGSTDSSPSILKSYRDPRLQVVVQPNRGQAAAWNAGFRLSRGQLVMFLDSDDYWYSNKVATLVAADALMQGDYGLIQHNLHTLRGTERGCYRRVLRSGDCFAEMKATGTLSFFVTTSGLAFSRTVLQKIFPLPESLRISPDAYLTRTAFLYGPVFSLPQALGVLRLHGKNAGMMQDSTFHDELRRDFIFPALNRYYQEKGIDYRYTLPRKDFLQWIKQGFWRRS